jgi:hypothetical protein
MDLESFIITVFCTIDDFFRQSGEHKDLWGTKLWVSFSSPPF